MKNYTREELEALASRISWENILPLDYTTVTRSFFPVDSKECEIWWRILFEGRELNAMTLGENGKLHITNYETKKKESYSKFEALKMFRFGGDFNKTKAFLSQYDLSKLESPASVGRDLYTKAIEDLAAIPPEERIEISESFKADVLARQLQIEANDVANARIREAKFGRDEPAPLAKSMAEFILEKAEAIRFIISDLAIWASTVILFAQAKVGKTTMVFNLIRSLVDTKPFLGAFEVASTSGNVGYINFELTENQCRDWSTRIGIKNMHKVFIWNLRGLSNPFRSKEAMEDFAQNNVLPENIETLIIDPLSGAFIGDTNNNDEVKQFFLQLERFKVLSGVQNLFIVVHAGNDDSKPRGATTLRDHPDAIWSMTKTASGVRYFKAEGRDVFVEEGTLLFHPETMELEFSEYSEKRITPSGLKSRILDFVKENPNCKASEIDAEIRGSKEKKASARNELVAEGLITVTEGARNAKHYAPVSLPVSPESYSENGRLGVSSRSPLSIGGTTTEKEDSLDWPKLIALYN